jgi:hypothetical protein
VHIEAESCGVVAALRVLSGESIQTNNSRDRKEDSWVSLTNVSKVGYWRIDSNDEAWVVTASFAMPAWQYRQLLSIIVRRPMRFMNAVCRWLPEIDPYACLIQTEWAEVILCWNGEIGAIAVLVPSELSEERRQSATQIACDFLAFACNLIGNALQPLSAFIVGEDDDNWAVCEVMGDLNQH